MGIFGLDNPLTSHGRMQPVTTSFNATQKLIKATEEEESVNQQQNQSIIGCLMYLSVSSRPDITYSVSTLSKFNSNPNQQHWSALKRVNLK